MLVDVSEKVQAEMVPASLGGLALGVVEVRGDGNDSVVEGRGQDMTRGLLTLNNWRKNIQDVNPPREQITYDFFFLGAVLHADVQLAALAEDVKGECLMDLGVVELASDEPLGIELPTISSQYQVSM